MQLQRICILKCFIWLNCSFSLLTQKAWLNFPHVLAKAEYYTSFKSAHLAVKRYLITVLISISLLLWLSFLKIFTVFSSNVPSFFYWTLFLICRCSLYLSTFAVNILPNLFSFNLCCFERHKPKFLCNKCQFFSSWSILV